MVPETRNQVLVKAFHELLGIILGLRDVRLVAEHLLRLLGRFLQALRRRRSSSAIVAHPASWHSQAHAVKRPFMPELGREPSPAGSRDRRGPQSRFCEATGAEFSRSRTRDRRGGWGRWGGRRREGRRRHRLRHQGPAFGRGAGRGHRLTAALVRHRNSVARIAAVGDGLVTPRKTGVRRRRRSPASCVPHRDSRNRRW